MSSEDEGVGSGDADSAVGLVRAALAKQDLFFKNAWRELEQLPPDERAAQLLIDAHDHGQAESWLVAGLLGRIGHPAGYHKVMEILAANDPKANSYGGDALVSIVGREAEPALVRLIDEVENGWARKAAARALARLATESSLAFLLSALERGRLRALSVAQALDETHVEPNVLVRALGSPVLELRRWPPMLIAERIRRAPYSDAAGAELERCADSAELRAALQRLMAHDAEQIAWNADRKLIERWLMSHVPSME